MRNNINKDFELYIEALTGRRLLPYVVFALFLSISLISLTLIFSPSYRQIIIYNYLWDRLLFICPISFFLTLLMTRRIRDISVNVFINTDLPFNNETKDDIYKYLQLVFSVRDTEGIKLDRLSILVKYQVAISLILSIILGIFAFMADVEKGLCGLIYRINQDGLGVAVATFVAMMLIFIVLNIINLLRLLSKIPEPKTYDQILKFKTLWSLPINIIYIYCIPFLITIPTVLIGIHDGAVLEKYANILLLLLGQVVSFIFVFTFPYYYVNLSIKNAKDNYLKKKYSRLRELEDRINSSCNQEDCLIYSALLHNVLAVEKIDESPNIPEIIKILITTILSIISIALTVIKIINI